MLAANFGRDQRGAVIVEVTIVMTLIFATFCKRIRQSRPPPFPLSRERQFN